MCCSNALAIEEITTVDAGDVEPCILMNHIDHEFNLRCIGLHSGLFNRSNNTKRALCITGNGPIHVQIVNDGLTVFSQNMEVVYRSVNHDTGIVIFVIQSKCSFSNQFILLSSPYTFFPPFKERKPVKRYVHGKVVFGQSHVCECFKLSVLQFPDSVFIPSFKEKDADFAGDIECFLTVFIGVCNPQVSSCFNP